MEAEQTPLVEDNWSSRGLCSTSMIVFETIIYRVTASQRHGPGIGTMFGSVSSSGSFSWLGKNRFEDDLSTFRTGLMWLLPTRLHS